jgi:hypothetical protein
VRGDGAEADELQDPRGEHGEHPFCGSSAFARWSIRSVANAPGGRPSHSQRHPPVSLRSASDRPGKLSGDLKLM